MEKGKREEIRKGNGIVLKDNRRDRKERKERSRRKEREWKEIKEKRY